MIRMSSAAFTAPTALHRARVCLCKAAYLNCNILINFIFNCLSFYSCFFSKNIFIIWNDLLRWRNWPHATTQTTLWEQQKTKCQAIHHWTCFKSYECGDSWLTFDLVTTFPCPVRGLQKVKCRLPHTTDIWNYVIQINCQDEPQKERRNEPF